ncbi:hypothetical protein WN48_02249 [Eufriesea mexicana]|uniref:Uncharacterized protein n=1 Tax=Eufriesea mexicana TaxID=516756 RepID=A0A310SP18_9HYME|nr:hypothetical protein WN48_02249 [Eufriesea mexicana]
MDAICGDGCFADLRRRGPSSDATIDLAVSMEQTGVDDTLIVIPVRKHPRCMAAADYADRYALLRSHWNRLIAQNFALSYPKKAFRGERSREGGTGHVRRSRFLGEQRPPCLNRPRLVALVQGKGSRKFVPITLEMIDKETRVETYGRHPMLDYKDSFNLSPGEGLTSGKNNSVG